MLFLISVISFIAIHLAPNSFFGAGELNPNMTPEAIEQLTASIIKGSLLRHRD